MGGQVFNPYWVMRLWNKAKAQFPNIRGEEDVYAYSFLCIERQIAYLAGKHVGLSDEDVALALAVCGLNVKDKNFNLFRRVQDLEGGILA